jgi:hypothetical protein
MGLRIAFGGGGEWAKNTTQIVRRTISQETGLERSCNYLCTPTYANNLGTPSILDYRAITHYETNFDL